jgi:hypothetical protein
MKWLLIYLIGYAVLLLGGFAALSKLGVLDRIGTEWTLILVAIAVGIGLMIAVTGSGEKKTLEVETKSQS